MALYPTKVSGPDAPAFRIRRARRGDMEAIGNLVKELGYAQGSDSQTINWVISHPEIELFVASDSHDKPVGMVTLSYRPQLRLRGRIGTVDDQLAPRHTKINPMTTAFLIVPQLSHAP